MIKAGHDLPLVFKSANRVFAAKTSAHKLDGYLFEVVVVHAHGAIHHSHTTLANFGYHLIIADGIADPRIII